MPEIRALLAGVHTIAVVGFSTDSSRAGYYVPEYLHEQGFRIIPVNPGVKDAWGEAGYASLRDIPAAVDLVLVFRRAEYCAEVLRDVLAMPHPPKVVWLQTGIICPKSRQLAEEAGIDFVQDRCLMVEHRRLSR